jgi:hypothetical protein
MIIATSSHDDGQSPSRITIQSAIAQSMTALQTGQIISS